tara:strand:+ start:11175 stop:11777 length:603 start_codon:yes stop_codon:yes gene_type:complete
VNVNILESIKSLKSGKPLVMVDSEDREFEGDLVLAAEKINEDNLNFLLQNGKGLMCLPCTQGKLDQFEIPMMHSNGKDQFATPFANSIDSASGITTGMSIKDRIKTINTFLSLNCNPEDLVQPGHLFPLRASDDLLREREGHTEGTVELLKLADMELVGVIVEIIGLDGEMLKGQELKRFAEDNNLSFISIDEIKNEVYN